MKANKDDFLATKNKTEIEEIFGTFYTASEIQTEDVHKIDTDFENPMQNQESLIQETNIQFQSRYDQANELKNESAELNRLSKSKSGIRQNTPKSSNEEKRPLLSQI